MCGLEQPGRIFFRSAEDQRVSREAIEGTKLFRKYLRKAGWRYAKSDRLDKAYVFLAKGFDAKTAEEGVSKFYGYDEIYRKWKSDPDFRRLYGGSDDEDTESEIEAVAPPSSPSNIVFGSGTGENQSADYNWLGQPTPGIPVAARRPDESAAERETIEEPGPATPCRQPKRGYPTEESKKQGNKRPKKKKSSSNTSRLAKSRPATRCVPTTSGKKTEIQAGAGASNVLLRSQNPSVVTPAGDSKQGAQHLSNHETAGSNHHDNPNVLRLSDANETIIELKKQLEDAQNLNTVLSKQLEDSQNLAADANDTIMEQGHEIKHLEDEKKKLRKEMAKEKVAVAKWKAQCEKLQDEKDRMMMNHAMEKGAHD